MANYKLKEQELQKRLDEFLADPRLRELDNDVALSRLMVEMAAQDRQPNRVLAAQSVLTRILLTQKQIEVFNNHFLSRRVILELGQAIVEIIIRELELAIPDVAAREPLVDKIMAGIFAQISSAENDAQDRKLLKAQE